MALIAGAAFIAAGTASAAPAFSLWRATRAPGDVLSLSDYALQPPDGGPPDGNDGEGDTTGTSRTFEPNVPSVPNEGSTGGTQPTQQIQRPSFEAQDTTARRDSLFRIPTTQSAPVETIGSPSTFLPPPSASAKQPAKSKRGVFGLHPVALIAAMVAMHILVVGLVSK